MSHECPVCGDEFDTRQGIGAHYAAAHDDDGPMDKMLLNELRELADQLGRTPKAKEITEYGLASEPTYSKRFGSWNDALREAELSENVRRNIPTGELLDELRRLDDEFDEPLTLEVLDEYGEYCIGPYRKRFGSWVSALEEIGVDPEHRYIESEADILKDLQRVADEIGKTPDQVEYREQGEYSVKSCQQHFGSWNDAIMSAGLEINLQQNIPDESLTNDLIRLRDELDHPPFANDVKREGRFSTPAYYERYGSWSEALRAAGMEPVEFAGEIHTSWKGGKHGYGPNWSKQRKRARERDENTCQICGDGVDELGQYPDVHHIVPAREFVDDGEIDHKSANDLDNLICLCRSCHAKWEGMPVLPQASD